MLESITFHLTLHLTKLTEKAARITNGPVDLSTVLTKYYKFGNIFSKAKAKTLAPYHLYNLQIKFKNREKPLIRMIYLFSITEQEALKKLISENLNTRFI